MNYISMVVPHSFFTVSTRGKKSQLIPGVWVWCDHSMLVDDKIACHCCQTWPMWTQLSVLASPSSSNGCHCLGHRKQLTIRKAAYVTGSRGKEEPINSGCLCVVWYIPCWYIPKEDCCQTWSPMNLISGGKVYNKIDVSERPQQSNTHNVLRVLVIIIVLHFNGFYRVQHRHRLWIVKPPFLGLVTPKTWILVWIV